MIELNFLALDTSSNWIKIAIQANNEVATMNLRYNRRADFLMVEIDHLLRSLNISLKDLDGMGCVSGPGHFTGLRSGLASIKAMAFASSLKISALPYAECLNVCEPTILLRRARRGWWYFSEFDGEKWYYSLQPSQKLKELTLNKNVIAEEEAEDLKQIDMKIKEPIFTAYEMLEALKRAFEMGLTYDHMSLKPFYVQRPIAQEKLMKGKNKL